MNPPSNLPVPSYKLYNKIILDDGEQGFISYQGTTAGEYPHGNGKLCWLNAKKKKVRTYVGEISNGLPHGIGLLIYQTEMGEIKKSGVFINGELLGKDTEIRTDPQGKKQQTITFPLPPNALTQRTSQVVHETVNKNGKRIKEEEEELIVVQKRRRIEPTIKQEKFKDDFIIIDD